MNLPIDKLEKALVKPGFIAKRKFNEAVKEAEETDRDICDVLVEKDLILDENLGQAVANILDMPFIVLKKEAIATDLLKIIPEATARKQEVMVFGKEEDDLKVAMVDPENLELIQTIKKKTSKDVIPYLATRRDLKLALVNYKRGIKEEFDKIISESMRRAKETDGEEGELPVVKIVDSLIEYAYESRASDIHVEPQDKKVAVRFRIDGILQDIVSLPKEILDLIVMRIKILSQLRTDEHRSAQDGKFSKEFYGERVDVRVSIVPVSDGEKLVMRLLAAKSRQFSLEELGFVGNDLEKVKKAYKNPYGMVLSTGPTGSGKTTTLYALLKLLNKRDINIATIEDPVEYDLDGINQIQVNEKANLTFADGLKSIMRQDPDVVMVGEIRDSETAGIAVNAAMTGHLVLSTLHTNDSATALPRLLDMDIESFLVSSTVNLIIAQRLIRKICLRCLESETFIDAELENLKEEVEARKVDFNQLVNGDKKKQVKELRLYRGRGCDVCNHTGYAGRIGIFEVLEITPAIKKLIMKKANANDIRNQAIEEGMTTMFLDGMQKVLSGLTTIDEILRVTRD